MTSSEAYEIVYNDMLENGIEHENDCKYKDALAPINEMPCHCYSKWWLRKAFEMGTKS